MMETILFQATLFLIQAVLLAIVVGSLWIVAKAKPWVRVLMFIVAVGAMGFLGFSTGNSVTMHHARHRFEGEFARPQRMLLDHLSMLMADKRYAEADACITRLKNYELEFYPQKGIPHTNFTEIVMGLIEDKQKK